MDFTCKDRSIGSRVPYWSLLKTVQKRPNKAPFASASEISGLEQTEKGVCVCVWSVFAPFADENRLVDCLLPYSKEYQMCLRPQEKTRPPAPFGPFFRFLTKTVWSVFRLLQPSEIS